MAFFKRIEVWVLLALTVAGVVAVLRMEQASEGDADADGGSRPPAPGSGPGVASVDGDGGTEVPEHWVDSVIVERDGDFAVVEIVLVTRAEDVGTGRVRLLRADGSEVPEFFVPFRKAEAAEAFREAVDDGSVPEREVEVVFWADRLALEGALTLDVGGDAVPVKADDGFDLDEVSDGGRLELSERSLNRRAASETDGGAS